MELESLTCDNCGARLDISPAANFVTCASCGSRLAIKRTPGAAYTEVLDRLDRRTERMAADLETIRLQNELERIDREWESEREQYMIRGRHGSGITPGAGSAIAGVVGGLAAAAFGVFWMSMAASMSAPAFFPLFGLVFIAIALGGAAYTVLKTVLYTGAERDYQQRREEILAQLDRRR
jgi:hypothetical protein